MALIRVNMGVCEYTHMVKVTLREDGLLDVNIESECDKVREYGEQLGTLTMADLGSITLSKIMDPMIVEHLTPTCLAPVAVFNAAWMETGLMSRSLAVKVGQMGMDFLE